VDDGRAQSGDRERMGRPRLGPAARAEYRHQSFNEYLSRWKQSLPIWTPCFSLFHHAQRQHRLKSLDPAQGATPFESVAVRSLLEQQYKSLFEQAYKDTAYGAIAAHEAFSAAVGPVTLKTVFPSTPTGKDLHMAARAIGGREALGLKRQTFFVQRFGWDNHDEVLQNQKQLLPEISQAVAALWLR
jgi:Protein of unknown function (DUF1501)